MSEEEKFVIKTLKDSQNAYIENTKIKKVELSTDEAKVVLNLIEKQNIIIKRQSYTNKKLRKTLKTVRKERNKQNKIIYKMAKMLEKDHEWFYSEFDNYTKQDFIDYFTNKVEESD